ncbi:MAG: oligosaccharide flippase family protein [Candidatus Pacebacteria bacterium]|nr:oligosaccharide flippase family protein [Candidatus Paceibacterota bacterium]
MNKVEVQTLKRKSVTGAASYFARSILLQAIGFVSALVLSAYFAPEDFGIYGIVITIIGILVFFSDIGLASTLIQKKVQPTLDEYRSVFTVQFVLSLLILLICIGVTATDLLSQKTGVVGNYILLALGISFPLATLKTIPSIMLERELLFSKLVLPQIVEQISFHGILIWLAISGWGAFAYIPAVLVRSVSGVIALYLIKRWKIGFSTNWVALRTLLGFGLKFQLNDFLARIKDQLFYLVLGYILPLKENGYVQWSKNWSMYPYNLTVNNVMSVTFPTFSRLQGHPKELRKAIEKSLFFITLAIFPILCGMVLFISPLLELFPTYAKWQPAIPSFIFFTLSIGWSSISSPLTTALTAIGQINYTLKLMVIWTILTWVLSPLLLIWYGFSGIAAAALLISFSSILSVWYVKRFVDLRVWEQVWRQLFAVLAMAVLGILGGSFWMRSIWWLLLGMGLTAGTYGAVLLLVGKTVVFSQIRSLLAVRTEKYTNTE